MFKPFVEDDIPSKLSFRMLHNSVPPVKILASL